MVDFALRDGQIIQKTELLIERLKFRQSADRDESQRKLSRCEYTSLDTRIYETERTVLCFIWFRTFPLTQLTKYICALSGVETFLEISRILSKCPAYLVRNLFIYYINK